MFRKQFANLIPILSRNTQIVKYFKSYKQSQMIEHKHLFRKSRFTIFNIFKSSEEQQQNKNKNDASKIFKMIEQEQNELKYQQYVMDLSGLLYQAIEQEAEKEQKTDSICLRDYIEDLVENSETLNKSNMYIIKFVLYQGNFKMDLHEQNQKYIDLFTSDQFIENDFETIYSQYQKYLASYLPQYLQFSKKEQEAIKICEKFLNDILIENEISSLGLQNIYAILISLYRSQNQHIQAFKLVDKVVYLIEQETYMQDEVEFITHPMQELVYLTKYCYDYQQYEYAYKLLDKVVQIMDQNLTEAFEQLSYEVNLLKNLDKHNKILLQIKTQTKNQQEEIEKSIQVNFIKSLEKFLDYQEQFNKTKEIKTKSQHINTLIDNNLHKFSSDSKDKILQILHKYDYNTN